MPRWNDQIRVDAPGQASPAIVRLARTVVAPIVRLAHRPTLAGTEHLPREGPYLLVANHSAGMGLAEIVSFVVTYLAQVGPARPLAGFVHPISFGIFPISFLLKHIGAIPSTYEAAESTLAAGVPILVFPGGDHETLRPIWQAFRVDFGGHRGFLRIARKLGVPIVPLGIRGGHLTAPVLFRLGRVLSTLLVLPRLGGLKRWGLSLLGVLVAAAILYYVPLAWPWRALLVWAWLASPFVFLSWIPWTIRMRIGPPIAAADLFTESDPELVAALARVEREVQRLVD